MTLRKILEGVRLRTGFPPDAAERPVTGLEYDSRSVRKGTLFFAFPGQRFDGRLFAQEAIEGGATAVISEMPPPEGFPGVWVQVEHGREALAAAARTFFGAPDERLGITGVTGTNGKTTICYLADSVLRAARKTTALIGTIEYRLAGETRAAVNTTPESLDLYRLFAELEQKGGTHVTMEASSHALALGRVYGIQFHTAVFTNLTRDHLDFHQTMGDYFAAKRRLFEGHGANPPRFAIINEDDPYGREIAAGAGTQRISYGIEADATARAERISVTDEGLRLEIRYGSERFPVRSAMTGTANVYNILAACCVGFTYGIDSETIALGIAGCEPVAGRFERVDEGQPFLVAVDYAHTDDALRNALRMARELASGRVITVFGCGGDRDRAKRPLMGDVAGQSSDFVVLTSDNPRSEDPLAIMNDAMVGLCRHDTPYVAEPDREKAIRRALQEAREGDVVMIAGKGHERYQVLRDRTIPFDDREVARTILRGFGYARKDR